MKNNRWLFFGGVAAVFGVSLVLAYYGLLVYNYPVPPGDDTFVHLDYIRRWTDAGMPILGVGYPIGFHFIVLSLSGLSGAPVISVMKWLVPLFLPISGVCLAWLGTKVFSRKVGLMALAAYALVSLQPLQTYYDGGFPNLLATGVIMPLLFVALWYAVSNRPYRIVSSAATAALFVALALTHHFSVVIALAVLSVWGLIMVGYRVWLTPKASHKVALVTAAVVALALVVVLVARLSLFADARSLASVFFIVSGHYPFISVRPGSGSSLAWTPELFGRGLSGLIFQGAFLGMVMLAVRWKSLSEISRSFAVLIAIWFLAYWIGSLNAWSGEPTRLGRDLSLPAAVLAAYGILELWKLLAGRDRRIAQTCSVLVVILCLVGFSHKVGQQIEPSSMVRFSSADESAYQYLLSSGLSKETVVMVYGNAWNSVAETRGDAGMFPYVGQPGFDNPDGLPFGARCYLVERYDVAVWPPEYVDHGIAASYNEDGSLVPRETFKDSLKTLLMYCK